MKVKCIKNIIDKEFEMEIGLPPNQGPRDYSSDVTINKEYLVLGVSHFLDSEFYFGQFPVVEIKNDTGALSSLPLFLFDIVDDRLSKYWHFKYEQKDKVCKIWPKTWLENDFYHDDLSNDFPEVLEDFERVCQLLEGEEY